MKSETIKVRASLTLASYGDLFAYGDIPLENKKLFLKSPYDGSWEGVYPIAGTDLYDIIELIKGFGLKQFYKINDVYNHSDVQIKLVLVKATEFDFFFSPKHLKHNTIYYVIKDSDTVTGPHSVKNGDPVHKYKEAVEKGLLWVISNQQTFEPFVLKKTA